MPATNQQLQDVFAPELWALEAVTQLYKKSLVLGLINRDFDNEVASKGDVVNTRMPGKMTAQDHVNNSFTSQNPDVDNIQVALDKWVETPAIKLDDRVRSMSFANIAQMYIEPAVQAIVERMETDVFSEYVNFYNYVGAAGTPLSGVGPLATNIVQKFNDELIPQADRRLFLNTTAANAWKQAFYNLYAGQNTVTFQNGVLHPTAFGMGNYESVYMGGSHTISTGWGTPLVNGAQNPSTGGLNTQTLVIDGLGSGTLKKGDIFTLNHGGNIGVKSYVLRADATITTNAATIQIAPVLAAAVTDNQALTVVASHKLNLAMHKDAITLVSRPLEVPAQNNARISVQSFEGVGLRYTDWYDPKDRATYFQFDVLYGIKTLDARKGFRVIE